MFGDVLIHHFDIPVPQLLVHIRHLVEQRAPVIDLILHLNHLPLLLRYVKLLIQFQIRLLVIVSQLVFVALLRLQVVIRHFRALAVAHPYIASVEACSVSSRALVAL